MKTKRFFAFPVLLLSTIVFSFSNVAAQNAKTQTSEKIVAQKLRESYFKRDFEEGFKLGQNAVKQYPDNIELQAWYLMNMARIPERNAESVEAATKFAAEKGENFWTLIALATAQTYKVTVINEINIFPTDSILTAEKLIKIAPDNQDAIFTYNSALIVPYRFNSP